MKVSLGMLLVVAACGGGEYKVASVQPSAPRAVAPVDDAGRTLPGLSAGGRTLIVGEDNQRYRIVVRNGTTARFEVVASVDGLDVIDGKPADPKRRGYIVDPHAPHV